jgi:hypothetical protein
MVRDHRRRGICIKRAGAPVVIPSKIPQRCLVSLHAFARLARLVRCAAASRPRNAGAALLRRACARAGAARRLPLSTLRAPPAEIVMIIKCLYIDTPSPSFLRLDPKYRAGFLDHETVWRYARRPEYELNEDSVRRAFAARDQCFGIRDGDTVVAYGWYSHATEFWLSETLRFHFDPLWVYMYRGFTHPAYRGQRLHAIGMSMALATLRACGYRGIVSTVETWNQASLKSCYRMGYRDFGKIYEVRLGRLLGLRKPKSRLLRRHLVFHTPGSHAFGFRLVALPPRHPNEDPLCT